MNIDEAKAKWADYDRKLDTAIRLNETRMRMLEPRAALRRMFWSDFGGIVLNGLALTLLGGFIAGHLNEPEFWLPAAVLHAGVIVQITFTVRQRLEIKALDYSATVLAIQKRLGWIRLQRVRLVKWTLWLSPLLWTPLLIVGLKGLWDVNAYQVLSPSFLVANLGFGALFPFLMIWLARHVTDRFRGSPRLEQLMDHLAGRSLANALASLREIADFAGEQATA